MASKPASILHTSLLNGGDGGRNVREIFILSCLLGLQVPVNHKKTHSGPFISGFKQVIWKLFHQLLRLLKIAPSRQIVRGLLPFGL